MNRLQPSHPFRRPMTTMGLLALGMAVMMTTVAHAQQYDPGITLIHDGQSVARLYISHELTTADLTQTERRQMSQAEIQTYTLRQHLSLAVLDFNDHLKLMSGATLPVVVTDDPAQIKPPALVVGDLAVQLGATATHQTPTAESYRLLTRDGLMLVGGEGERGYSHGLYTLLYELGCDWIMPGPDGQVIPQMTTITLPAMDRSAKPVFEVRSPWYSGGSRIVTPEDLDQFEQWKQRMRQTNRRFGANHGHPRFMTGGHFWHRLIRENRELLTQNPEMRALVRLPDGTLQRGWGQLEPTHPKVIDLTVQWIKTLYEKNNWPKDHAVALSIGPNDGDGYSISADALAAGAGRVDPVTGDRDQTDVLVWYANQVLERLSPEYPNLHLGFYIYSVHADYPARHTPHPKFAGHFADITYSRYHSTLDPRSHTRQYYRQVVEQWGKLSREQGNPLWFYGYNWNLAENLMPYSKMKIWGQDLPWYHQQGILGHNNEQDKAWSILGPHNYLMARMGWDIDLDWRQVLKEYTVKAFGAGAGEMEAYYLDLIDTQERGGHEAGAYGAMHLIFDRAFIDRSRSRFARATAQATSDFHRRNVEDFSQAVTALEIHLDYRDAIAKLDFTAARKAFERMDSHFQTYLEKNANLVSRYGRRYLDWLVKPYVEQGLAYSTGDYRILEPLPDELPTLLDPNTAGQFMGFYEPAKPDDHLIRTRTWSTTWDAQGLWPLRDGAVWYRHWFNLTDQDAPTQNRGIGLFLGAFEDTAHVWCNGQYVGHARGFIKPAAFDLTAFIKPGRKNLLAIQIIRTGKLNEMNLGGILYPSFLFAGPRLEHVAPATEPMQRILPGGSREDAPQ